MLCGLVFIPNSDGPSNSSIQKWLKGPFKLLGFKIEISSDIEIANFLDVTLNLSDNTYKPFLKTDQYPSYINVKSNHANAIIKQVPKAVIMRIRRSSSCMKIFQDSSKIYIDPLGVADLEPKIPNENNLYMNKENTKCSKKNRKRKIIWFTHPIFVN